MRAGGHDRRYLVRVLPGSICAGDPAPIRATWCELVATTGAARCEP
ncbi:hypothetical protein [Rhodoferax sp.]|nr:hypothetical protein [Rhodoferax sp.]MDD2917811.1 hypothetical protein [Rhodoferax sp.]